MTGSITYGMAIPIIMGQNIGTCITAIMSCIGANTGAKRVATMHTLINTIGSVVILPVYLILNAIIGFSFHNAPIDAAGIALCHTLFNIIATVMLMPNGKLIIKLTEMFTKEKGSTASVDEQSQVCVLDERLLRSPSVAVQEASNYTMEMCTLTRSTIIKAMGMLDRTTYSDEKVREVLDLENIIDLYEDRLGTFLVKLSTCALSREDSHAVSVMLHTIGDFERMSDHAVNILGVAKELREKDLYFSDDAKDELRVLSDAIMEIMEMTEKTFINNDLALATQVEPLEQVVDDLIDHIKHHHIERMRQGKCTIEMGFILSDLLNNYSRVSDHCSNVAVAVIEVAHNSFDTHQYLNEVKYGSEEFVRVYNSFAQKYAI